jgi:hypothetical protein
LNRLSAVLFVTLVPLVHADPCSASVYAETYALDPQEDGSIPIQGMARASGPETCYLQVTANLYSPTRLLDSSTNYGYSEVTSYANAFLTESSPEGNYYTTGMAWANGQFQGCSNSENLAGQKVQFTYRIAVALSANLAEYHRCNEGSFCYIMYAYRAWFGVNPGYWPEFISLKIWRFNNWMVGEQCLGYNAGIRAACVPDGT